MAGVPDWAVDAGDIPDGACLLRRVPPNRLSGARPDTSNFQNKQEGFGLSVTFWESDGDLEDVRRGYETFGVVTIVAADARALGLLIARSPLDDNPNHCEIFPTVSGGRRTLLRNASQWVVYPDAFPLEAREPVVGWSANWEHRIPPEEVVRVCG